MNATPFYPQQEYLPWKCPSCLRTVMIPAGVPMPAEGAECEDCEQTSGEHVAKILDDDPTYSRKIAPLVRSDTSLIPADMSNPPTVLLLSILVAVAFSGLPFDPEHFMDSLFSALCWLAFIVGGSAVACMAAGRMLGSR